MLCKRMAEVKIRRRENYEPGKTIEAKEKRRKINRSDKISFILLSFDNFVWDKEL